MSRIVQQEEKHIENHINDHTETPNCTASLSL